MTVIEKIIRFTEITNRTDIEAGRLATLLALIKKIDITDATKVMCCATSALCDEKSRQFYSVDKLVKFCELFNCTPNDVLGFNEKTEEK